MKYFLYVIVVLVVVLIALLMVAVIRTLCMKKKTAEYVPNADAARTDCYAKLLSKMVQYETISDRSDPQVEKFRGFHSVLEELFPTVHKTCEKTEIDGNLLFRWKGKTKENPILIMSHMDVVEATGVWKYPPFAGVVADGKVWGRGTADTKCSLMAFLQAAEELIQEGYVPNCDVYLASSCTEEIGGSGAPKIASYLKEQGIHLAMLCDEGGGIIEEPIGGIKGNFAMVGVFEKGYGDVRFIAKSTGGHASAPPKNTPIPRLARFIHHIEKHNPFRVEFSPEVCEMFTRLAPYADFPLRMVLGNLWLFKPLLRKVMPAISAQAAAMLQTTIAFTMQQGSSGYNVIPQEASVCANLRFIPHQSTDESLELLEKLAKDAGLDMEVIYRGYPSKSVDVNGTAFKLTEKAIDTCFHGVGISPYIVTGGTDARFYGDICDNCIRFSPVIFSPQQMKGMHGLNENIACNVLPGAVDYYKYIIKAQ